jgi:hypothetical protein
VSLSTPPPCPCLAKEWKKKKSSLFEVGIIPNSAGKIFFFGGCCGMASENV